MKIVKNNCFGGFGLSPKAYKRIAELLGEECHFFDTDFNIDGVAKHEISLEEAEEDLFFDVYTVPNPEDYNLDKRDEDGKFTTANKRAESISFPNYRLYENRTDPILIQVVEELGKEANGRFADLAVVEIPDDIEYEFIEYDGVETIHEKHRSW